MLVCVLLLYKSKYTNTHGLDQINSKTEARLTKNERPVSKFNNNRFFKKKKNVYQQKHVLLTLDWCTMRNKIGNKISNTCKRDTSMWKLLWLKKYTLDSKTSDWFWKSNSSYYIVRIYVDPYLRAAEPYCCSARTRIRVLCAAGSHGKYTAGTSSLRTLIGPRNRLKQASDQWRGHNVRSVPKILVRSAASNWVTRRRVPSGFIRTRSYIMII